MGNARCHFEPLWTTRTTGEAHTTAFTASKSHQLSFFLSIFPIVPDLLGAVRREGLTRRHTLGIWPIVNEVRIWSIDKTQDTTIWSNDHWKRLGINISNDNKAISTCGLFDPATQQLAQAGSAESAVCICTFFASLQRLHMLVRAMTGPGKNCSEPRKMVHYPALVG